MLVTLLLLWLMFIFSLLVYLFKKYLYDDLFNEENINKRKIELIKEKEYLSKKVVAINLSESKALINKFNWGAFLIPFLWGLAFGIGIKLLICLIPIPFLPNFIFGIKGNKWALSKYYKPIEAYKFEQNLFIIIGIIINLILIPWLYETIVLR